MQGDVCDANAMEISLSGAFILMSTSSGLVSACLCHISTVKARDLEDFLKVIRNTNEHNLMQGYLGLEVWEPVF